MTRRGESETRGLVIRKNIPQKTSVSVLKCAVKEPINHSSRGLNSQLAEILVHYLE